jgi:hypothetical protein
MVKNIPLGFEVHTVVLEKSFIVWDIMYRPMKVNRRFGVIYRFLLQGLRVTQAINQLALCFMLVSCLPYSPSLKMVTI